MTGFPGTEPVFSGRVPAEALRQKNRKERSRERVFRKRKPIVRQNRYRRKTLDGFLHRVFFVFGWRGKKRKKARRMGAGKERKAGRGAKERGGVAARRAFNEEDGKYPSKAEIREKRGQREKGRGGERKSAGERARRAKRGRYPTKAEIREKSGQSEKAGAGSERAPAGLRRGRAFGSPRLPQKGKEPFFRAGGTLKRPF